MAPFARRVALSAALFVALARCAPPCGDGIDALPASEDASWSPEASSALPPLPARVLLYTRSTGFRHDSIPAAITAIEAAVTADGVAVDASENLTDITAANLARYGAVVLVSTTGEPFGPSAGAPGIDALLGFVRGGGGVVGLHAVEDIPGCNDYAVFIGGTFRGHPGNVRTTNCTTATLHPAVAALPAQFTWTDEFHEMWNFRPDNHVVLRCDSLDGTQQIPIAYWRLEGSGRLFVSTLGHPIANWSDATLVAQHVVPAVRWAMRRD